MSVLPEHKNTHKQRKHIDTAHLSDIWLYGADADDVGRRVAGLVGESNARLAHSARLTGHQLHDGRSLRQVVTLSLGAGELRLTTTQN